MSPSKAAVEAAEEITRKFDEASRLLNGPRLLYQEIIDETARDIDRHARSAEVDKIIEDLVSAVSRLHVSGTKIEALDPKLGEAVTKAKFHLMSRTLATLSNED